MNKKNIIDISLLVPVYNVAPLINKVLESIKKQDYPIREIIVIDNHSSDNSVEVVKRFINKNRQMKIKLIQRDKTYGISASYNLGAKLAKGDYLISLHSDSILPTSKEVSRLIEPFLQDSNVITTYPLVVHPRDVWLTYNFWQKCLFGTVYATENPSMNGKFDCYKKSAFLKIGGYNEKRFHHGMGTEDADMHHRLGKEGKVVATKARVIHLHGFEKNYSLKDWIARRKFLSISYGRYIKMHAKDMGIVTGIFFIKPLLLASFLLGFLNPIFFLPVIFFPFIYFHRMFSDTAVLKNPRIVLLLLVVYFLIFYETFWLFESILFKKK